MNRSEYQRLSIAEKVALTEREVVRRLLKMRAKGESVYAIAKALNKEGTRTRYGKEFKVQTVLNILARAGVAR